MLVRIICALALFSTSVSASADQHRWRHYLNARFGTEADYPADLFEQPFYPANGDGVQWTSRGGAELTIYGSWNALDHTPKKLAAFLEEHEPRRYAAATYRKVTPTLLVLSGVQNGRVFYERHAFGDPSGAVHAIYLEYPVAMRSTFDPIIKRLSRSLGWASAGR